MSNLTQQEQSKIIEGVLVDGNLKELTSDQRIQYYNKVCESLGLNPLTKPFEYITLQGKLILYARKDATEQLRKINGVSITKLEALETNGIWLVTAYACDKNGRQDISTGAVSISGMKGDILANAMLKAETKAKRRVTLSLCGLGILDETDIETISHKEKQAYVEKESIPKLENIDIENVLEWILQCETKEELEEILERARNSVLIKDKNASNLIKKAKEDWEKKYSDEFFNDELPK